MTDLGIRPPADTLQGTLYRVGRHHGFLPGVELVQGTLTATHMGPQVEYTVIELDAGAAPWLQVMVTDINQIALLPPGWDSYGADPLRPKAALHAIELLDRMDFCGPAPWVSPSKDGGLHLEWSRGPLGLELEVTDQGDVDVVVEDHGVISEWSTGTFGDADLLSVLNRVTAG